MKQMLHSGEPNVRKNFCFFL